jgi:4-amino-4-deoxy-L-arabinose transferase-like glycosyltransferase
VILSEIPLRLGNRWLIILLLAALGLRLGWVLTRPADERSLATLPDQREYLAAARNLLAGHGLHFVDLRFDDVVYAFRTPGYPAFIAACAGSIRAVRIVQAVLGTFTVLAAFLLARRWLAQAPSLLAAAIVAVNPFLIYFTGLILTETLFTAMLAWGLVLLVTRKGRWCLWGGLVLALSILVRPGEIGLPILLALLAAIVNRDHPRPYQKWPLPVGATMLLLTLLVLFPWALRNRYVLGTWIWTDTNAGFTAYDGFNPNATGASNQDFVGAMPQLNRMNEVNRSRYLADRASVFIRDFPGRAVQLAAVKLLRTWSPQPLSRQFARPLHVTVAWIYAAPFYLLILIGIGSATLSRSAKLLLLGSAIYLSIGVMLSVGSLRYRVPADVPMAVLAASGAAALLAKFRRRDLIQTMAE